jgi:hypothetical protein
MDDFDYAPGVDQSQIQTLMERANNAEARNAELTKTIGSMQSGQKSDNFLHLQISTSEMLEKLEHFYRGDIEKGEDENGNINWIKQENNELVTFNDHGVTSLMEIVTKYIDKNTILSYYDSSRIYEILADIGDELVLFMQCNYRQMGMDTYFKKTKFRLVVATTLHIIESTYRRAIEGRTLEEMNQSKVVGQFGSLVQQSPQMASKPLNPIAKFFNRR